MKIYTSTPKQLSRQNIIDLIRYGWPNGLDSDLQYWTTCGNCTKPGTEFDQVISSGLVRPNQFHGVDYRKEVIEENKKLNINANFYYGDFFNVIIEASNNRNFHPGIVHFDSPEQMGINQSNKIAELFEIICTEPVMPQIVTVNSSIGCWSHSCTIQEVINNLCSIPKFSLYGSNYRLVKDFKYKDGNTELHTLYFVKG